MLDNSSLSRGVLAGFSLCQWRLDRARLEAAGWRSDQPPHSLINQVVVKTVHLALLLVLTPPQTRYQLSSTPTSETDNKTLCSSSSLPPGLAGPPVCRTVRELSRRARPSYSQSVSSGLSSDLLDINCIYRERAVRQIL